MRPFGLTIDTAEVQGYFAASPLLQARHLHTEVRAITCQGDTIDFHGLEMNSYYASVLADLLRRKALQARQSFSFETVMSSPDKVDLLREARAQGFRTYLYYIATEDPEINVQRVKYRVAAGGHDVPEEKIISRYHRSLRLLGAALRYTHRAFFFDTSAAEAWYFAEATDGTTIELKSDEMPRWFQPVWDQF